MRATTICAAAALALLAVGVAAGVAAQAELFSPGITGDIQAKKESYTDAILVHGLVMYFSLPLAAGLAMGLALLGQQRQSRALAATSGVILGFSILAPLGFYIQTSQYTLGVQISGDPAIPVAASLAGLVLAILSAPAARPGAIVLGFIGLIPLVLSGLYRIVLANGDIDHTLNDTYFDLAATHASGLSVTLWCGAIFFIWACRDRRPKGIWLGVPVFLAAILAGLVQVIAEGRLGLQGMPRQYADYPSQFAGLQRLASWAGFALAASLIGGAALVIFIRRGPEFRSADAID